MNIAQVAVKMGGCIVEPRKLPLCKYPSQCYT